MKKDILRVTKNVADFLDFWSEWEDGSYGKGVYNRYANIYNKSDDKVGALSSLITIQRGLKERIEETGMDQNEAAELTLRVIDQQEIFRVNKHSGYIIPVELKLTTKEKAEKIVKTWIKECWDQIEEDGGVWRAYLEDPMEGVKKSIIFLDNEKALTTIIDGIIFYDYPSRIKVFEELTKEQQEDIRSRPGRRLDSEAASQQYIEKEVQKLAKKGGRFTKEDGTPKPTTIRDELINHSNITLGERALFNRVKRALQKMQ